MSWFRNFQWRKFKVAITGISWAVRTQPSFHVHVAVTIVVIALAGWLRLPPMQWSILLICISSVFVAELFNTAIEELIRAIHPQHDPRIGRVLDISAGAVLLASLVAVLVGLLIFANPILALAPL